MDARRMHAGGKLVTRLSEEELVVVALVAWHYTDREIAECLAMSEGTVHRRFAAILQKLHATNRRQAAQAWVHCAGVLKPPPTRSS